MRRKNTNAFTLLEILIVIALVAVLAGATIILLNPMNMFNRAVDTKKKADLGRLKKALEEYYNDKGCYPTQDRVCYLGGDNGNPIGFGTGYLLCYICGTNPTSPRFTPYLEELPCDPGFPTQQFLYVVDNKDCPKSYQVYAQLSIEKDPDSIKLGCALGGCGPTPYIGYEYGDSSPNSAVAVTKNYYCRTTGNKCNFCGTFDTCTSILYPNNPIGTCREIFIDKFCTVN